MTKEKQIELRKSVACKGGLVVKHVGVNYLDGTEIGVGDGAEISRNEHLREKGLAKQSISKIGLGTVSTNEV